MLSHGAIAHCMLVDIPLRVLDFAEQSYFLHHPYPELLRAFTFFILFWEFYPYLLRIFLYVFIVGMYVSYEHIFHMAFCSSGPNWTIKKEYFKLFHRTVFLWSWPVPSGSNISLPSASPFTHNICVTVPCFGISIQYPAPVCLTLRDLCTNSLYILQGSLNPKPG